MPAKVFKRQKGSPLIHVFGVTAVLACAAIKLAPTTPVNIPAPQPQTVDLNSPPSLDAIERSLLGRGFEPAFAEVLSPVLVELRSHGYKFVIESGVRTKRDQERIRKYYERLRAENPRAKIRPVAKGFSNHFIGCAADIWGYNADGSSLDSKQSEKFFDLMHQLGIKYGLAPEIIKAKIMKIKGRPVEVVTRPDREHMELSRDDIQRLGFRKRWEQQQAQKDLAQRPVKARLMSTAADLKS